MREFWKAFILTLLLLLGLLAYVYYKSGEWHEEEKKSKTLSTVSIGEK